MAKKDLRLQDLKGYLLSPVDIFWIKTSGSEVLIARKADFLNFALIEKLSNGGQKVIIADDNVYSFQHEFLSLVKAHQSELLFKEKIQWKNKIFESVTMDKISQFELGQLAWMAWSKMSVEEARTYIDFDLDLFKRSLNVASSYVFCAFLLGYYQDEFLKTLYTNCLRDQMSMEKIELMDNLKAELELIREHDILTEEDKVFVQRLYPKTVSWAGERYNGSGIKAFNKKEMSDLEIVMIALERHFSYRDVDCETLFDSVKKGVFRCEEKILNVLKKGMANKRDAAISA